MAAATSNLEPVKLFFSYAHKDHIWRDKLATHLEVLRFQGLLEQWSDVEIQPGQRWEREILRELDEAQIILLLISSDFLASEYINAKELGRALEREAQGTARVIPVIVRPCLWEIAEFAKLQALPTGAKAISLWDDKDKAMADVARGIHVVIEELQSAPAGREDQAEPPLEFPVAVSLRVFPRRPLRIQSEDYDPFRAMKQVFDGACKGAYPELPEMPACGTVQFEGTSHRRILAELIHTQPRVGLPYDVIAIPYRALGYCVEKGLLQELDDDLTRRHAEHYLWWRELGMIGDHLYGVPLSALTMLLAVRRDLFDEHRLTPPDTWEAYVELIGELEPGALAVAPDLLEGRCHVTLWYNWLNYLYAEHSNDLLLYCPQRFPAAEAAAALRPGTLRYLQAAALLARHTTLENPLPHYATANWDAGIEQFSRGRLLMHLVFNDALETLRQKMQISAPEAELEYLPIPRAFGSEVRHGQIEGWVLCIPKGTDYYWPAIALLDWFLDEAVQRVYSRWGGASAHRRVIDSQAETTDGGRAFKLSTEDFLAGRATVDLVKCQLPNALRMGTQIVDQLYDAVLAVGEGVKPEKATKELTSRLRWYLRVAS